MAEERLVRLGCLESVCAESEISQLVRWLSPWVRFTAPRRLGGLGWLKVCVTLGIPVNRSRCTGDSELVETLVVNVYKY